MAFEKPDLLLIFLVMLSMLVPSFALECYDEIRVISFDISEAFERVWLNCPVAELPMPY